LLRLYWRSAPTSLTLREHVCGSRSDAHATKSQLFTSPWGIPRETQIGPKPDSSQLEALRLGSKDTIRYQFGIVTVFF